MKKVLIVGSPGAGKSTFAREFAKATDLPLIHLDVYFNNKKFGFEGNRPLWRKKLQELMKADEWILDGDYTSTFKERFEKADTVIFFDFPLWLRLYGITQRRWEYRNKKRPDMPDDWKEKANLKFYWFVLTHGRRIRPRVTSVIKGNTSKKIIIFKNRIQARKFLESLETGANPVVSF